MTTDAAPVSPPDAARITELTDLLRALYNGPQEGSAVYEAAKLDTGRYLRALTASGVSDGRAQS